uniref:putative nuclease HARBI1 n=1 Tax=Styela clava TaxID=7725 RepID=UPI00193A6343|nr:putative nuclease HARBI1 [Styela clava]
MHPILCRRKEHGEYYRLVREMRMEREAYFKQYFHMTPSTFDRLLNMIESKIVKQTTNMREPIPPEERLAVTLRYLVTGDSYQIIGFSYRIHKTTISRIIPETCAAIWDSLQPVFMAVPSENQWKIIANDFKQLWQFPNCVGSIDGKHVVIQAPANSGSSFFNYKKTFSLVLLAVSDAKYRFIYVDVGAYRRQSDGNVFASSSFGKKLLDGSLDLPKSTILEGMIEPLPHVFLGDEAFPLKTNLMRPFPGTGLSRRSRIFNYRLSRARRVVENAFGIMVSRFRIFRRPICVSPARTDHIIKACTVLHNFLRYDSNYFEADFVDHEVSEGAVQWKAEENSAMLNIRKIGRPSAKEAGKVREQFSEYFVSEKGALPWQDKYVFSSGRNMI